MLKYITKGQRDINQVHDISNTEGAQRRLQIIFINIPLAPKADVLIPFLKSLIKLSEIVTSLKEVPIKKYFVLGNKYYVCGISLSYGSLTCPGSHPHHNQVKQITSWIHSAKRTICNPDRTHHPTVTQGGPKKFRSF